jgi:hypothetical protein
LFPWQKTCRTRIFLLTKARKASIVLS